MRANSLVKSIEKAAEIDRRSIPGDAPGHPKWTQNRCLDPLGRPRGVQERPEDVSGASRERPGASPAPSGSARRVAKGAPERQKGRPGAPGSAPWRPKSMPSRVREQKNRVVLARFARRLIFIRFLLDFDRFSDVRASRSGSALAAKFDQFSVRACEARPSRNTAHSDEFEGRPF